MADLIAESVLPDSEDRSIDRARANTWSTQLARHASQQPHAVAIRYDNASTTWRELHERVRHFSQFLSASGIGKGDRVALVLGNRPEFLETLYAVTALGAIAVPVNFRLSPREIAFILTDSGSCVVVTESVFAAVLASAINELPASPLVVTVGRTDENSTDYESALSAGESLPTATLVDADHAAAAIMYTSGTTGNPKGAVLTHANFQAVAGTMIRAWGLFDDDEITLAATPLFHIGGLGAVNGPFAIGATIVIAPTAAFNPAATLELIETEKVTSTFMVPAQWQALCATADAGSRASSLRTLAWGAAPATIELLTQMSRTFPDAAITAVFGQTEMAPVTCVMPGKDSLRKIGSVGRPAFNVSIRIVDESMKDVPVGEIGEIVYRGPNLMLGYWNNPDATRASFDGGWFHSGDLVRQDDEGYIYVVDRKKDMIISGGENIYSAEVENALSWHPGVRDVAVIGRPDTKWGESVVALVVPADPDNPPTLEELILFTRESLASYKKPRDLVIVGELPRNATGKITKNVLRQRVTHSANATGAAL